MPERAPEVERFVADWLLAKQAADVGAIAAGLARYEDALAIGTDVAEWHAGDPEFVEAHTAGAPFAAMLEHVEAHREGPVAWAAVRAKIEGGAAIRLTLVLVQDGDTWRIVQSHASRPAAG